MQRTVPVDLIEQGAAKSSEFVSIPRSIRSGCEAGLSLSVGEDCLQVAAADEIRAQLQNFSIFLQLGCAPLTCASCAPPLYRSWTHTRYNPVILSFRLGTE